jgi:hypothetical protein
VRVAVRCIVQLVAEMGEPLTGDGFLKMMAQLVWNRCPNLG